MAHENQGTPRPARSLSRERRLAIFAALMLGEFLYGWAWNSVDVLRPFQRSALGLTLVQAGSTYSAQGAGALIGAILIGQLADRFGRRNVAAAIIMGYGLSLLSGLLVASYPQLLAQRFVLGLFTGGVFPVGVSIYVNLFEEHLRGRVAGMLNACFSSSIVALGLALGALGGHDWHLLLWIGGVPPLLLAGAMLLLIPAGSVVDRHVTRGEKLPVRELFHPGVRRQTLLLATMTGLNFFGYQAYSGWLTTYLTGVRGLSAGAAGNLVAWQFAGNIIGGFAWGWAADRFGRRFNASGFLVASVAILVYLSMPTSLTLFRIVGLIYGSMLCSSVIWGPWLAELYPPHLRSTAASIFNWGRIISFFAPLATGLLADRYGLPAAMASAAVAFAAAALIWLNQRETLRSKVQERSMPAADLVFPASASVRDAR
ncbi:MFS transporter [Sphingomonas sp. BK345]|uniref:MFS transporter n=1 Tax=Sphingomonas sp. BK345 TaxID=2586980 RepID=UPI00160B8D11|nr:MFS transporter [Sphingomonas sp. BK345]MBB3472962.1 MFS family permease [Sphingomonas sp. BK345]